MDNKKGYRKLKSGGAGTHGVDYQINLLTLFLLDAYDRDIEFRLSTENKDGGKFDDVVLQTDTISILLQAKHKENEDNPKNFLTFNDIFPSGKNRDEFNLHKYIKSFPTIKKNFKNISALILCTNTTLTSNNKDIIKDFTCLQKMEEEHVLYVSSSTGYYSFNDNCKQLLNLENPEITEDDINSFLEKLQLISINNTNIDGKIEILVKRHNFFNACTDVNQSITFLKENVKIWFENRNGGIYITPEYVETFRSKYFIRELEKLNVQFEVVERTQFKYKYSCYIIQNKNVVNLHLLKIYQNLKAEKIIVVNPLDETSTKMKTISSFKIDEFVYLVVPLLNEEYRNLRSIIRYIANETFPKEYKKIIFVTDEYDIAETLSIDLNYAIDTSREVITYQSFSETFRAEVCSRTVTFQEKEVVLTDIIPNRMMKSILDESILLRLINKNKIIINQHYKETVTNFYVSRVLYKHGKSTSSHTSPSNGLSENALCDILSREYNITVLLVDDSGMGKTTVLSNFQRLINSKSNLWITKIHLNEHTKLFKKCLTNGTTPNELLGMLVFREDSDVLEFERKIFQLSGKVVLMLDAVDEIHPNYFTVVSKLIEYCKSLKNIRNIIIPSRQHCKHDIIQITKNALVYSLARFSENDQIKFLSDYWTANLKLTSNDIPACEQFVILLKQSLSCAVKETFGLVAVPLQIQIIGDVFEKHCSDYINTKGFNAQSLKHFNVVTLYDMLVEKKKNIYIEEKSNASGNTIVKETLGNEFDRAIENHTILAILSLFQKQHYNHFKILPNQDWKRISHESLLAKGMFKMGILQEYRSVCVKFSHRTFAEYFVAIYICNSLSNSHVKERFLHFLIRDVFLRDKYVVLQMFINGILERQDVPDAILTTCGSITAKTNWTTNEKMEMINLGKNRCYNLLRLMLQKSRSCHNILKVTSTDWDLVSYCLRDFSLFKLLLDKGARLFKTYKNGATLLHLAVKFNCNEIVINFLIANRLNVNAQDFNGNSPLHYAIKVNSLTILKVLIDNGADINIRNTYSQTPLLLTYSYLANDCSLFLIDHGADMTTRDNVGRNILHVFLYTSLNSLSVSDCEFHLKIILKSNYTLLNSIDIWGSAPLHYAVDKNNILAVQLLLAAGAGTEIENNKGETPLLMACCINSFDCVICLIDNGADIAAVNKEGGGVLHCLLSSPARGLDDSKRQVALNKILEKSCTDINSPDESGMTALHYAVRNDYILETKLLLAAGANQEMKNNEGETPLLLACSRNSLKSISCLLKNKSDVTAISKTGRNVLHNLVCLPIKSSQKIELRTNIAHRMDYELIVNEILNNDYIDIDSTDNCGSAALHCAVENDNILGTNLLLAAGADTEIRNNKGMTPLLWACFHDSFNCAEWLMHYRADLTSVNYNGRTVLHILLKWRLMKRDFDNILSQILQMNSIDINSTDANGVTALQYAVSNNYLSATDLLLAAGADTEVRDNKGATPLLVACRNKAFECAINLIDKGADVAAVDYKQCNILHYLARNPHWTHEKVCYITTKIFEKNCIDINDVCSNGKTAFDYALQANNLKMKKILLVKSAEQKRPKAQFFF